MSLLSLWPYLICGHDYGDAPSDSGFAQLTWIMSMNEPEDLFAVQSADQFKMDGNNNNRITGPPAAGGQFSFPASLAGYAASGAAVGHDVSLAQILYYQSKWSSFSG